MTRPRPGRSGSTPARACSPCRRCSTTSSRGSTAGLTSRPGPAGSGGPARLRRRHACSTPRRTRRRSPPGSRPRSARRPADDWERLWRRAGRVWDDVLAARAAVHGGLTARPWPGWPGGCATWPRSARAGPCAALGRSYLRDPRLRMLLDRYATYAGSDPRRAPAALVAIPYAELTFGGWYLRGGLATLADALLRRGARRSASGPDLGTPVDRDRRPPAAGCAGRAAGRRSTPVPADVVVANADAAAVYRDLLPDRRRARPPAAPGRSLGGFVLLLGVRGPDARAGPPHRVLPARLRRRVRRDLRPRRPGRRPIRPSTSACADDPAVRAGRARGVVRAGQRARRRARSTGGRAGRRRRLRRPGAGTLLAARGLDVRDRVLFREVRTPADLRGRDRTPGRGDLRHAEPRADRAAPPAQPGPGARAVPGRRLDPPRRRPADGHPVRANVAAEINAATGPPDPRQSTDRQSREPTA